MNRSQRKAAEKAEKAEKAAKKEEKKEQDQNKRISWKSRIMSNATATGAGSSVTFSPENAACLDSSCPLVRATIPHEVGVYYHDKQPHNVPNCRFTSSNPPPFIWEAMHRAEILRNEMNMKRHEMFSSGNPNRWVGVSEAKREEEITELRELEIRLRETESPVHHFLDKHGGLPGRGAFGTFQLKST